MIGHFYNLLNGQVHTYIYFYIYIYIMSSLCDPKKNKVAKFGFRTAAG